MATSVPDTQARLIIRATTPARPDTTSNMRYPPRHISCHHNTTYHADHISSPSAIQQADNLSIHHLRPRRSKHHLNVNKTRFVVSPLTYRSRQLKTFPRYEDLVRSSFQSFNHRSSKSEMMLSGPIHGGREKTLDSSGFPKQLLF